MQSDCMLAVSCITSRVHKLPFISRDGVIYIAVWILITASVFEAAVMDEDKSEMEAASTPCWQVEEFVVSKECAQCTPYESKSSSACSMTGYVETIRCPKSKRDEYKSCRSAVMEEHLFWKFEGSMVGLTVIFAVVVVFRQRALDRLASEKVRKQIESI
ncbi:protein JTB [Erpetoichthys calabaricus]|uniref:Protein JTB n=1 Tax=Erpetoichthys calabaricus TaxID=27687 RepID=A0A8C4RQA8_ERPCA|nr:protein JTB [Erpetoichthys calabaricus]